MLLTGLDWKYFNWQQMEFFGNLNLLKTGLVFADALNTVSPRYADEIQSEPLGCGLEGVLQHRREVLSGIVNGVNYDEWNPAKDSHLATRYDVDHIQPGKSQCKAALQKELGLEVRPESFLLGFIGRLVEQKGIDLISSVLREWVSSHDAQWAILGTGEAKYQDLLSELARRHPGKIAVRLEFSNPLAHRIEAGSDAFVMPSRFEPCGLNQLYSLRYGTVPIVRATGGLVDTIINATDQALDNGTATGFSFREYSSLSLSESLRSAEALFHQPDRWHRLVQTGMRQDWSWRRSAQKYVDLYQQILRQARHTLAV
jgi:starch synthase